MVIQPSVNFNPSLDGAGVARRLRQFLAREDDPLRGIDRGVAWFLSPGILKAGLNSILVSNAAHCQVARSLHAEGPPTQIAMNRHKKKVVIVQSTARHYRV